MATSDRANRGYTRGDRVWWWSEQGGKREASKAVFIEDDRDFPVRDVILAIKIGPKPHTFRWPRRLTRRV